MNIHKIIIRRMLNVVVLLALVLPAMPAGAADPAAGAEISAKHCATCHGETGNGDGDLLKQFKKVLAADEVPKDWTNGAVMAKWTDEQLVQIIEKGGTAVGKSKMMPAWGPMLSKAQIADLVAYIRSLTK